MRTLALLLILSAPGLWAQASSPVPARTEGASATPPAAAAGTTAPAGEASWPDHGLLEPDYFGLDPVLLRETKQADFFYAKPGLSLKGRTLRVSWEPPRWLVTTNEKKELETGKRLSEKVFPEALATAMGASLWPGAKVSTTEGDLLLTGRIVMINVRNGWWSQAREAVTFDLKVVDPATKEVLLAAHHRFVCHPMALGGKGNDLELRIAPWALGLSEFCRANFLN